MLKRYYRSEYEDKRKQLDAYSIQERTAKILSQFRELDLRQPIYLLSYSPLVTKNEFDVGLCDQLMLQHFPELKIAWPKIGDDTVSMQAYVIGNNKLYLKNRFDILEPLGGESVDPLQIDIVFVPLLAFDKKGYRVGYGKGYYDRYLKLCRRDVLKVGFSFFDAVDHISDINEFDVPLNLCISPTRIYEF